VLKPRSFSPNSAPKIREGHQLFFGLRLESEELQHSAIQTKIEQHFGGFFHQTKVCQPIGRKDSMQTVIRISRRLDLFLHEEAQNFELFKYSRSKLKNQKHIAVDVLIKAYPSNDTTLRLIQSGRTVPLTPIQIRTRNWILPQLLYIM
jgi:hypothetical protein